MMGYFLVGLAAIAFCVSIFILLHGTMNIIAERIRYYIDYKVFASRVVASLAVVCLLGFIWVVGYFLAPYIG